MEEKTFVDDINRSVYDIKNEENDSYRIKQGLTPEIVEKISEEKHDPAWMREFRLKSLEIYNNMQVPDWGPSIDGLNMDNIATYVRANTNMKGDWKDVPEEIKDTFDRLGIPKAERESLATQSLYTIMSVRRLLTRVLYTLIWKVHLQVNMQIWYTSIL